jgi:hypothetical protein
VVNFTVIPANTNFADAFASRGIIGGFTEIQSGNNSGAGVEANEPNHYFTHGLRTVWVVWTAPISGLVTVDTIGSTFDTILAVYTNAPETSPSLATLKPLIVNDDLERQQRPEPRAVQRHCPDRILHRHRGLRRRFRLVSIPSQRSKSFGHDCCAASQPDEQRGNDREFQRLGQRHWTDHLPMAIQRRDISGATSSSFTIDSVQPANDGNYDVVVANPAGSVTSVVARLVVRSAPAIVTQPQDQMVPVGSDATFTVVATGGTLSYQWRFNGATIPGATSATYTRVNVQPAHAGAYTVLIANSLGAVVSQPATLTLGSPLTLANPQFASGVFSAQVSGGAGNSIYVIEVSTNLTSWSTLTTVSNATGPAIFTDANTSSDRVRAYRARLGP